MKARYLVTVMLALFLFVVPAQALTIIDFEQVVGAGGVLTFFNGDASGAGIPLGVMKVEGTTAADGEYETSGSSSFGTAVLNFNTETNFIEIIGGIPDLSIPNDTTLLAGTFSDFYILFGNTVVGSGPDEKSEDLLFALGIPLDTKWLFFGFTTTGLQIPGTNSYTAISTDIKNEGGKIPEPISLILLGSGLAGVGLVRRFRKK